MSEGRKRLVGLGLVIFVGLVIVLGITKPNPFAAKHTYWAVFDTAHGLGAIDRDVRIAGVKIGDVGKVERTGDDVRVELILSEDYPLHTDARVDMKPHTLFEGSNFVDLAVGSPGAPRLDEGETIPRAQTTNYVTLDRALRVLRPEIRDNLQTLAAVGADTLRGEAVDGIQTTLENLPEMARNLAPAMRAAQGPGRRELVGSIRGLSRTVDALARERGELVPLNQRLNRTATALDVGGGAALDAALRELPPTLEALNRDAPALSEVTERLSTFASELGVGTPRALARSLKAATPVLTELTPVLRDGRPVVKDARLVARRLANAKGGLQTMFRVLRRPLETFPGLLEVANAQTRLGASGALQLAAGAFEGGAGAFSGFNTPQQNPDAPGHFFRTTIRLEPSAANGLLGVLTGQGGLLDGLLPVRRAGDRPSVLCETVAKVSPSAVALARENGVCR